MSYNDKVDFVNSASKQLEAKLANENRKLHEMLKRDAEQKSTFSEFDDGARKVKFKNFRVEIHQNSIVEYRTIYNKFK